MTSLTALFSASILSAISTGVCGFWVSNSDIFFFSSSKRRLLGQGICCTVTKTNIALSAVMLVFLSEVAEQHPASAHILRSDILFHRFDAGFIPGFAFFVDGRRDMHKTKFLPFAGIYNIRCLLCGM